MCNIAAKTLIPLDIVLDYPVVDSWEWWKVLRDLVQNFYDEVGADKFASEFHYDYQTESDGTITILMKTYGHPFSYEWLTYFGGSTKTGKEGYAGCYGEGFKVCALCLNKRGYSWTMESSDWKISPQVYEKKIDGKPVPMLGYSLKKREDNGWTILTVKGVSSGYETEIKEALLEFFYPENPLFGKKIAETNDYAVYERSSMPIPCKDYVPDRSHGILYYKYMARGWLPFNLIILAKNQNYTDESKRDRNLLLNCQVNEIVYRVAEQMNDSPETSYYLLNKLQKYWRVLPQFTRKEEADIETWYYVICQLVRNVSRSNELKNEFKRLHPNLVYLDKPDSDNLKNNRIRKAKEWYKESHSVWNIVNPIFRKLGVPSLLEMYEKYRAHMEFRPPDEQERCLYDLIIGLIKKIMPEIFAEQEVPAVFIADSGYNGNPLEFSERVYGNRRIKYRIQKIVLNKSDFEQEKFYQTFLKAADICLHTLGTDNSAKVNAALTYFAGRIACRYKDILIVKKSWEERF